MNSDTVRREAVIVTIAVMYERCDTKDITDYRDMLLESVGALPSADRPQGDSVSRRYLLAEIDDLADEFSEVDENGLHSERWCGISDAKCVILNAPSVSDRPQDDEFKDFDRESLILLIEAQKERIGELLADKPQGEWIEVSTLREILGDVQYAHRGNSEAEAVIADVWDEVKDALKGVDDE